MEMGRNLEKGVVLGWSWEGGIFLFVVQWAKMTVLNRGQTLDRPKQVSKEITPDRGAYRPAQTNYRGKYRGTYLEMRTLK